MSLSVTIDGVEYASTRVRLRANGEQGIGGLTSAADGTGSQGLITLDDPFGEVELRTWMPVIVEESACTANPRLFTGYIAEFTEKRGKYKDGPGREIDITINDQNILLSLRLLTGGDTVRPEETDTARLAWLIDSAYLSGIVFDTGFINGLGRDYDADNLHGLKPAEVLDQLAAPRGQVYFAFWDAAADKVGLFYDAPTVTTYTSSLTISNVLSDESPTCVKPYVDFERRVSGEDINSNIRFVYKGGVYYTNNLTTAATFFPAPLLSRGINVENDRVGKASTAKVFADRILVQDGVEMVVVSGTVRLHKSVVGLIDAGMRLGGRWTHLTGFETLAYTRVESKVVNQSEGTREWYDVGLVLSTRGTAGGGGGGGGGSTLPFPVANVTPPTLAQSAIRIDGSTFSPTPGNPTDGNLLAAWMVERSAAAYPPTPTGWTSVTTVFNDSTPFPGPNGARLVTKIASGDTAASIETDFTLSGVGTTFMEWGGATFGAFVAASDVNSNNASDVIESGPITPTAANAIVVGCVILGTFGSCGIVTPDAGVTVLANFLFPGSNNPDNWVGYKTVTTPAATTVGGLASPPDRNEYGAVAFTVLPVAGANPTMPGGPVGPEIVTMTGASGTTAQPFAPGSLRVFVDNIDETGAITSQDPTTGGFTLGFIPKVGEVVTVTYVAA